MVDFIYELRCVINEEADSRWFIDKYGKRLESLVEAVDRLIEADPHCVGKRELRDARRALDE